MRQRGHRPDSRFRLVSRTYVRIWSIWLLVAMLPVVRAQQPGNKGTGTVRLPVIDGNDLRFRRISTATGLSQTRVSQIVQDNQGFLWFATQYGLNRYDGYEFKVFKHEPGHEQSLSGVYIYSLFKDRTGTLWIGTDQSLDSFDPVREAFTHHAIGSFAPNGIPFFVKHISQDSSGLLWLSTQDGLYSLDPRTNSRAHYLHDPKDPSSLSSNDIRSTGEDKQGRFWVTSSEALDLFNRSAGKVLLHIALHVSAQQLSFYEDHFGVFWILYNSGDGVMVLDRSTNHLIRYSLYDQKTGRPIKGGVYAMLEDEDGALWLATSTAGLLRFERKQRRLVSYRNYPGNTESLADDHLTTLFEDRERNIWVGLHQAAPDLFSKRSLPFEMFRHQPGNAASLGGRLVTAIYEDPQGILWIGSTGAFDRIDRNSGRYVSSATIGPGITTDTLAILRDRAGVLWIGTAGQGVGRFDKGSGRFRTYQHDPKDPSSLSNDVVNGLLVDHTGTLWVSTWDGLDRFNPERANFTVYRPEGQSSPEPYGSMMEDPQGDLWISGVAGLQRFNPSTGRFTIFKHNPDDSWSLSSNRVVSTHIDRSGTMWVATKNGLDQFDARTGHFKSYYERDGLGGNAIDCILEDGRGNLWMNTNKGISRFDPVTKTFTNYSSADGLPGEDLTGWCACFKSPGGEMFFGGYSGATAFYPDKVRGGSYIPPIVLTDLWLAGSPVEIGENSPLKKSLLYTSNLTLSHRQNVFSLTFAALSYSHPAANRYRYKLEGLDRDWNEIGSDLRLATYTTLPAGKYTFRVQGATSNGPWSEPGVILHIEVLPPWWSTWWFRVFCTLATAGILWLAHVLRVRSIQQHSAQLALMNTELEAQIAERKQAEAALRQAQADLTRANRVSSMGELTASLAHEVNQPIAAAVISVNTCLRWLTRDQPNVEEARAAAARIAQDIRRAGEIINRVRLLFKKGTLQRELVDLNEIIHEMTLLLHSEVLRSAVLVRTELAAGLPQVMGDRVQLQQVLMNLMMNSIDAMKDVEGSRELTIQSQHGDDGQVLISVSDTGIGLPPQQADKIFNAFFTTKAHGTGMGLRISRSIVESHQGRLWAVDNPPRGTRFCFTVPSNGETRASLVSGDRD
jgi:signal transduction histidine kinase/ligand-binding sensor domain-containing protein